MGIWKSGNLESPLPDKNESYQNDLVQNVCRVLISRDKIILTLFDIIFDNFPMGRKQVKFVDVSLMFGLLVAKQVSKSITIIAFAVMAACLLCEAVTFPSLSVSNGKRN